MDNHVDYARGRDAHLADMANAVTEKVMQDRFDEAKAFLAADYGPFIADMVAKQEGRFSFVTNHWPEAQRAKALSAEEQQIRAATVAADREHLETLVSTIGEKHTADAIRNSGGLTRYLADVRANAKGGFVGDLSLPAAESAVGTDQGARSTR